jgi:[ribosomal protein S5]-alanine N-acetyltransferase
MTKSKFILQGEKIILRDFVRSDISDTYIGWLNSSDIMQFSNQRFSKHSLENSLQYLASFDNTNNLFLSIFKLSGNSFIGTITVYLSNHHGTADIGILIGDKSVWGLGYGQDAFNLLIKWLFECNNIRKVTAGTLACNYGMLKIMERSGMHHEATRKNQEIINGKAVDIIYYAKFYTT